jgi:hypothetical protein
MTASVTTEGGTMFASPLNTVSAFEFVATHDDRPSASVAEDDDVAPIVAPSPPITIAVTPDAIPVTPVVVPVTPDVIPVTPAVVATTPTIVVAIVIAIVVVAITSLERSPTPIVVVGVAPLDVPRATIVIVVVAIAALSRELGRHSQRHDHQEEPGQRPHRVYLRVTS